LASESLDGVPITEGRRFWKPRDHSTQAKVLCSVFLIAKPLAGEVVLQKAQKKIGEPVTGCRSQC
jgi:hypothetical protein